MFTNQRQQRQSRTGAHQDADASPSFMLVGGGGRKVALSSVSAGASPDTSAAYALRAGSSTSFTSARSTWRQRTVALGSPSFFIACGGGGSERLPMMSVVARAHGGQWARPALSPAGMTAVQCSVVAAWRRAAGLQGGPSARYQEQGQGGRARGGKRQGRDGALLLPM